MADEDGYSLAEVQKSLVGGEAHFRDKSDTRQKNSMIAVAQQRGGALDKVLLEVRDFANDPDSAQCSLKAINAQGKPTDVSRVALFADHLLQLSCEQPSALSLCCLSWLCTFFLIYMLELPSSFSTSEHKSRDISAEAMLPIVQRANPTMYMLAWFRSLEGNSKGRKKE